MPSKSTPITILTGFLGSGKTTIILNTLPQLPPSYRLCLLKNEFGDVAIDSQLASTSSISGTKELLNGCICCNLVGQLGDALETLKADYDPDRIVVETSGSAFPATLVLELNRFIKEKAEKENDTPAFVLDGVVSVIDAENWEGYEDTSPTARIQAKYTDMVVFNKWENVGERRWDDVLDRLGDLEISIPWVKSDKGKVPYSVLFGIDGGLAAGVLDGLQDHEGHDRKTGHDHAHSHDHSANDGHMSEVEVLGITLQGTGSDGVDLEKLGTLLSEAPKDEVYRIKAFLWTSSLPKSSEGTEPTVSNEDTKSQGLNRFILNWAFGRWTFTYAPAESNPAEPVVRMTIITAQYESTKLRKRLENEGLVRLQGGEDPAKGLEVKRIS